MGQRSLITSIGLLALASLPVAPLASAAGHPGHKAPAACVTAHAEHGHKGRQTSRSCHATHARTPVILVFKGTVVAADDTTLTVQSAHQVTHTVTLTDTTLTVAPDGSAATVAVGDDVRVTARVAAGGTAQAVLVEDYSSAAPDDGSASDGGGTSNGDATATAVPDQPTQAPAEPTQGATETPSQPAYQVLNGTITALDGASLTIQAADGAHTFPLGSHISIRLANGTRTTDLTQVTVGVSASVYVRSVDGGPFSVCGIVVGAPGEDATPTPPPSPTSAEPTQEATETPAQTSTAPVYQVLNGTITALDDTSLTVQAADGAHTFPLATQVSVRLADRTRGSLAQVTVGVEAEVYVRSSDGGPFVVVGVVEVGQQ